MTNLLIKKVKTHFIFENLLAKSKNEYSKITRLLRLNKFFKKIMLIKKFWKLYPKSKNRRKISLNRLRISPKIRKKIMKFGKDYFDSLRDYGYGGYYYNKKFLEK